MTTRRQKALGWAAWHVAELAGIGVPAALATTYSAWFLLLSAAVTAHWVAHEVRVIRRHHEARTAAEARRAIAGPQDPVPVPTKENDHDQQNCASDREVNGR